MLSLLSRWGPSCYHFVIMILHNFDLFRLVQEKRIFLWFIQLFPVLLANLVNDVLSPPSKAGRISRDIKPVSELVIHYPLNIIW